MAERNYIPATQEMKEKLKRAFPTMPPEFFDKIEQIREDAISVLEKPEGERHEFLKKTFNLKKSGNNH